VDLGSFDLQEIKIYPKLGVIVYYIFFLPCYVIFLHFSLEVWGFVHLLHLLSFQRLSYDVL